MARKKKKTPHIIGFTYDPEGDAAYVRILPITAKVHKTIQVNDQVNVDVDCMGRTIGVEILR